MRKSRRSKKRPKTKRAKGSLLNRRFGINIISVNNKSSLPKLNHEVGVNLSLEGALIKCTKFLKARTRLGLDLMLVRDGCFRNIKARGEVSRCEIVRRKPKTYHLDVRFFRMPRSAKQKLTWFLN